MLLSIINTGRSKYEKKYEKLQRNSHEQKRTSNQKAAEIAYLNDPKLMKAFIQGAKWADSVPILSLNAINDITYDFFHESFTVKSKEDCKDQELVYSRGFKNSGFRAPWVELMGKIEGIIYKSYNK